MAFNPYQPPGSDVRDLQPGPVLAERPLQVAYAVRLLWLSIVIAVALVHFELQRTESDSALVLWIFAAVILALAAALNIFVWRGANWARIVVLVLGIFSAMTIATTIDEILGNSGVEIALEAISLAVDVAAIYLLFTKPGVLWFRRA